MKSSTGAYFIGLDHIRALAAFLVFAWHFQHVSKGHLSPPPTFPLSLLSEGHTGVALFMALSGYLFAKLLDDKKINYKAFIWNRILRLAPLLIVVIILVGVKKYLLGQDLVQYAENVLWGWIKPTLPNGGWSITAEFHFYLLLPLLLFISRKSKYSLLFSIACMLAIRSLLFMQQGEVQYLGYWTIIGRLDQFILGIAAYQHRHIIAHRHLLAACVLLSFSIFYWYFDYLGGFYLNITYPSPSPLWIIMPAIEGAAYGFAIAWYDSSFKHSQGKISKTLALIGTCSYSIYLLHFFFVFQMALYLDRYLIAFSNIHIALLLSVPAFLVMLPISYLSYRFIELPALHFRTRYIVEDKGAMNQK